MSSLFRVFLSAALLLPALAHANDAAAGVAAGGLQLRTERRVTMAKERLLISEDRIRVEYEFVNEAAEDVTTEVAFPVPPLPYRGERTDPTSNFRDFRAWVDDAPLTVKKAVRALHDGVDVTDALAALGITIEDFGGFDHEDDGQAFTKRLGPERMTALRKAKLIAQEGIPWPKWDVAVTWHWTQTFPPGKVVRVRHEYAPAYGYQQVRLAEIATEHADGCFEPAVVSGIGRQVAERLKKEPHGGDYVGLSWVKYILTTANTWRMPIRDFEVLVERREGRRVSFCWDGKVERVSNTAFRAKAKDFVPARELIVYFY